ncbi:A-agglutinin anchorage subunit-like [Lingula anatina]|uniref:A-agglutinin anchorage subunit-like n=1 Tax=Lingula anatina TaxID=7574 RepID=A0A1S3K803_LINAN|nr:A-agglutinin anchorage subunit-like [Lingula anatina]|eukprot:XP_013418758.1 A-agglutinin anchorage subunit-like [Lingula anatina]
MASFYQSLVVLLCFVQSGTAIQCLDCQSFGNKASSLLEYFYHNYDQRCEDNPSAATSFAECSGSCYYLRVTQSLTKTDANSAVNTRDWVRGCLATTSVEEGCMNLTLANLEDIQNILSNVSIVTAMEGRLCVCNSDRCNVDTTSLATLPQVPAVQCPRCEYMQYSSDDSWTRAILHTVGGLLLGETDQKCVSNPSQTKTVSCRGSCLSVVGEGRMSVLFVSFTLAMTERMCSASKSADGCSRLTNSDAALTGLFSFGSNDQQISTTSAEVCTCNQDGCTRAMTTVSGASTTTPTKTTPNGIASTSVTHSQNSHVSTTSTTPHSTKKPQTSSGRGVCNLELLLTTLMAATYCVLWYLY